LEQADSANQVLLLAFLDVTASGVGAASVERSEELLQRDSVALHFGQVRFDLILLHETAIGHNVSYTRHGFQLARDRPVLNRPHVRWRKIACDSVSVDFTDRRCKRSQVRRNAGRQVYVTKTFQHLLPRKVRVDGVIKSNSYKRQAELCM